MENKIAAFTFFSFLLFIVSAARLAVDPSLTNPSSATVGTEEHDSNILLPGEKPNSDLDSNNHNHNHNHNRLPDESEKTTNDLNPRANFSRFHPINRHFHGKAPPRVQKPIGKQRRPCRHSHQLPSHKNPRNENDDVVPNRMNIHDRPKASDDVVVPNRMNIHNYPRPNDVVSNRMNIHGHPKSSDDVVPNRMNIHGHPEANDVVPNRMNIHNHPEANDVVPNRMNIHNHPKASRGEIQSNWFKVRNHHGSRRYHDKMMVTKKPMFDREKLKSSVRQQKQKKREEEAGFMKSIRKFLKHTFD